MIRSAENSRKPDDDSSYTRAADHSTAAAIGKEYHHEFQDSANADKRAARPDDGQLTSDTYARGADSLADQVTHRTLRIDYHHPLEDWIARRPMRWLLGKLAEDSPD